MLKTAFLEMLCERGYLRALGRHVILKPARRDECWGCYGSGCERCDYTGTWRELAELELVFAVMRFEIADRTYTWHQPVAEVTWDLATDLPIPSGGGDWRPGGARPIAMPSRKFSEGKALIRWVLNELVPANEGQTGGVVAGGGEGTG